HILVGVLASKLGAAERKDDPAAVSLGLECVGADQECKVVGSEFEPRGGRGDLLAGGCEVRVAGRFTVRRWPARIGYGGPRIPIPRKIFGAIHLIGMNLFYSARRLVGVRLQFARNRPSIDPVVAILVCAV